MTRLAPRFASLSLGVLGALGAGAQEPASFPPSTALAEGVSPEALARLDALVQGFVDDEEVVGAELLVLKAGRSILHRAYGWRDLEAREPMPVDSVFCVRSMTKPLIGTSILMLVDDGRLKLTDRIATYLPELDVDGQRDITVEHLLTHTSGLPMSEIMAKDLHEIDGIRAVAALGGAAALDFAPGSAVQYSDQGADTLTALIEVVTGAPAEDFVRARVLEPLGMRDSTCLMSEDSPLRPRALPKYAGSRGAWSRFWGPDEPPLFPFFLGSQGLYSTTTDYARFLDLWMHKGRPKGAGRERLLGARFVRKALLPGPHPMNGSTGFPGLRTEYGFLMELWTGPVSAGDADEPGKRELVAFGHTGSDGTHAWAFPRQDALVLYFTQSRGTRTGLRVEEVLGELLLGAPFDPNQVAPPFEDYLGYYREDEGDLYRAIVRDGDDLALEILGRAVVPMRYAGEDRWKLVPEPTTVLAFDRAETGEVTGYHIGEHVEHRFEPASDLPSADEVAARIAKAHRLDLLETLGPLRMEGELTMEKHGVAGRITTRLAWPDRFRIDTSVETGGAKEFESLAKDGEHVWSASKAQPRAEREGVAAELLRDGHPFARFGDLRRRYPKLRVIQRLSGTGEEALLLRTGDTSAPATTLYVHAETGRVGRVDSMTFVDSLGRIGQRMSFDDFRDVSGMTLPFRTKIELANPMIGPIVTTVETFELGVDVPDGVFELAD